MVLLSFLENNLFKDNVLRYFENQFLISISSPGSIYQYRNIKITSFVRTAELIFKKQSLGTKFKQNDHV